MSYSELSLLRDKHLLLLEKFPKIGLAVNVTSTHSDIMKVLYEESFSRLQDGKNPYIKIMKDYYRDDLMKSQGLDKVSLAIQGDLLALKLSLEDQHHYAFITVGWNEQTITPKKMLSVSTNILNLKYFKSASMVLEKHRENGIHHHTHYLVEFVEKYPMSKVIGWIYQTKGVKELCLNKSFIDYLGPQNRKKPYQTFELYSQYLIGNKKEAKLKYIRMDDLWRNENNIPHLIHA